MCEYSSKLIFWLDHELPPAEAEAVDRHLAGCRQCREHVDSFRNVSDAFALHIRDTAALPAGSNRRWFLVPAAIAAAVLVAVFFRTPRQTPNVHTDIPRQAVQAPAVAQNAPLLIAKAPRPHVHLRTAKPATPWTPAEPTIQLLIPADSLFPPGALPEGVGFVADFRLASDGSPGGLISRP
jgi:anti-sigma factor RsiW